MNCRKVGGKRKRTKPITPSEVAGTVRYIRRDTSPGKVFCQGAFNFHSKTPEGQLAEMVAAATQNTRSHNPLSHWVLSWAASENPNAAQCEQAARILMTRAGADDHLLIYAGHRDTDNVHVHALLNKVSPTTGKVIEINKGFDIEWLHQTVAEIEAVQGWKPEANALYSVGAEGELIRNPQVPGRNRQLPASATSAEMRTGAKSPERTVGDAAAIILKKATGWDAWHASLAQVGFRYVKSGSGAAFLVKGVALRASDVHRAAAFGALEKRFGPFSPGPPDVPPPASAAAVPLRPASPFFSSYAHAQREHEAARANKKGALRLRHASQAKALKDRQAQERAQVMSDSVGRSLAERNRVSNRLAELHRDQRERLAAKHAAERKARVAASPPFPSYTEWLRAQKGKGVADAWIYQRADDALTGPTNINPQPVQIAGYDATRIGMDIHYCRAGDRYTAFVDSGKRITVLDPTTPESVRAALQVAQTKWATITVTGSDQFKRLVVQEAVKAGTEATILNRELADVIADAKKQHDRSLATLAIGGGGRASSSSDAGKASRRGRIKLSPAIYAERPKTASGISLQPDTSVDITIYKMHFNEARSARPNADISMLESEAALAMRMTGHSAPVVKAAVCASAPLLRAQPEPRNWTRYGARIVDYAFGAASTGDAARLHRHTPRWVKQESGLRFPATSAAAVTKFAPEIEDSGADRKRYRGQVTVQHAQHAQHAQQQVKAQNPEQKGTKSQQTKSTWKRK